jgi:SAM-dependent methyltransferase
MAEGSGDSISYYDRNAERFAADTSGLDMSALYERFLHYVPVGGRILDAGCGIGRDALAFAQCGYPVVAFDASLEMARLAKARVAGWAEVLQISFADVAWQEEFDGVWACASLLHVSVPDLPSVLRRLRSVLRPGRPLYMSFKYGSGERIVEDRRFTDQTEESMSIVLSGTGLVLAEAWVTGDVRAGRSGEHWLNAIAIHREHDGSSS